MCEHTYNHDVFYTRVYTFILKYLSSEAKLQEEELPIESARIGGRRVETCIHAMCVSTRFLSGRLGVRDYISGWWVARSVCVRLAFALFLEITLFVVLLSLYIFTGGRFTFSLSLSFYLFIYDAGLVPVCVSRRICLCVPSIHISLSLPSPTLHHRDFVIPRFLRQCMRRRKRSCAEVSVALGESNVSLARLLQVISRLADSR